MGSGGCGLGVVGREMTVTPTEVEGDEQKAPEMGGHPGSKGSLQMQQIRKNETRENILWFDD